MTDEAEQPHSTDIDGEQFTYEEVEGVISNKDDPSILCFTFRACFLGFLLTIIRSSYETYMAYRTIPIYLESLCYYVLAYPLGRLMAISLPRRTWTRWRFSLNPGPFSIKEHALAGIMAFSTDPVGLIQELAMKRIYAEEKAIHPVLELLYVISILLLGFGLAGVLRRFLIWPSNMIWPGALPFVALLRTLHEKDTRDCQARHTISRFKLLIIITISQFIYSWLPHYIMPVLKEFSWLCMMVPDNKLLAQITSANGFGMTSLQLDWYSLTQYLNSPVIVPRWVQVNLFIGFVSLIWFAGPLIYYLNLWDSKNLPISSIEIFTRNGTLYNYTIIADKNYHLNMALYQMYNDQYGPIRFSTMYILFFATNMAFLPALLVHTLLHHGKWIIQQARTPFFKRNNDIHCKLMTYYSEIPEWCCITLFVICLLTATLLSHFIGSLPGYYALVGVSIGCITVLPYGIFIAQTAQDRLLLVSLTCFFLGAVIVPSDPFGLYAFVDFVIRIQDQTLTILLFLKISHFMKLPPRVVFTMVILSTILSSIVSYFISEYFLVNIPYICKQSLNPDWGCKTPMNTFLKAVFLAIIHPSLLFGRNIGIYYPLVWCILIGALLPIPFWLLSRQYSTNKYIKHIHIPLILGVCTYWYDQSSVSISTWLLLGLLASFVIQRWWYRQYALISSVALTIGVSLTAFCVHFIFTDRRISFSSWWGTGGSTDDGCSLY